MALLLCGCATPTFRPVAYAVNPGRPYTLASPRVIHLVPVFDRISEEGRAHLDPAFNPSAYVTGMVETELAAAGVKHDRVSFAYTPSFAGLQKTLQAGAAVEDGGLVLSGSVNFFPNDRIVSCDFRLYSSKGDVLFEKRCLCMNFSTNDPRILEMDQGLNFIAQTSRADLGIAAGNRLLAAQMVMQQLLADPAFQKALQ